MKNKKHTPLLAALATLVVLLAGVVLIWLAKVRPDVGKGRSEIVTDFLRAELLQDGQTATQVFTYDKDILTIGLEFYLPGDQPCGALDVVLYDADTGEELSRSVGTMDYIVPDQYTTLGMDPAVTGQEGRRYKLAVTPHYATDAILAIGHSDGVALWKEQMAVDDRVIDGTMAMQITYQRIGGYLTRFFLLVGGLAAVLAALAVWAVLSKKLALHRLVLCWCSALDCCTALCCRLMLRPTRNTTSTRVLRWPAAGPTTCPTTSGGWVRCPRRRASAASVTRTPICKTRTRRSLRGRRSPPSCSPPQTSPLTAIRNIMNCRPTRTRFCTSSVRRQYFWPMCCILALRPRCFWGALQICCSLRCWRRWRSRPRRSASGSLPWPRCCP